MYDLKKERMTKQISQMRLSLITGIARDRISRIECDYLQPTKDELKVFDSAITKYNIKSRRRNV